MEKGLCANNYRTCALAVRSGGSCSAPQRQTPGNRGPLDLLSKPVGASGSGGKEKDRKQKHRNTNEDFHGYLGGLVNWNVLERKTKTK
jgi:hypothetical protein